MRRFLFLLLLTSSGIILNGCSDPAPRSGTIVGKTFVEAHGEIRHHDVYTYGCGPHRKFGSITPKYGCGTGYFSKPYEAKILECREIEIENNNRRARWCIEEQDWETLKKGDSYVVKQGYAPGSEQGTAKTTEADTR